MIAAWLVPPVATLACLLAGTSDLLALATGAGVLLLGLAVASLVQRKFRFSLRSLLGLMLASALILAAVAPRITSTLRAERIVRDVAAAGLQIRPIDPLDPPWIRSVIPARWQRRSLVAVWRGTAADRAPRALARLNEFPFDFALWMEAPLEERHLRALAENRQVVEFRGVATGDEGLAVASTWPELRTLQVERVAARPMTDAGLALLGRNSQLQSLFLDGQPLRGAAFADWPLDSRLRYLSLSGCPLDDAELAALVRLPALDALNLQNCPIGDQAALHLGQLRRLRMLSLQGTQITDAGMRPIGQLERLEDLTLPQIGDEGLAHLSRLVRLRRLDLSHRAVSDLGLTHLEGLSRLVVLRLDGTQITDAGLASLDHLPLLGLSLADTQVSDAGLAHVALHPGLLELDLRGTRCTPWGIARLRETLYQTRILR